MSFEKFYRLESPIWACRLTPDNQQAIMDEFSAIATAERLADYQTTLNDVNNVMEHTFRYRDSTLVQKLQFLNWLIRRPNGQLLVMTDAEFSSTMYKKSLDYVIPDELEKTFESALLTYVNTNFPDMYLGNQVPTVTPYVNLVPTSVECDPRLSVQLNGVAAVVEPVTSSKGEDLTEVSISIQLAGPKKISKYLVGMCGDSFNAPKHWSILAYNTVDGTSAKISEITAGDNKPGYYTPKEEFLADKFVLVVHNFEMATDQVNQFMFTLTVGGEIIEVDTNPKPFTAFTATILEQVAERLSVWYNQTDNHYTVSLPTLAITEMSGLSDILPVLMKASFVNPDTTIGLSFTNGKIAGSRLPNQLNTDALQYMLFQIRNLPTTLRKRITMLDLSSTDVDSPSTVCASVLSNTTKLWDTFVENIIKITGIDQPAKIKK